MIFSEEIIRKWQTPEKEAEMEKKKKTEFIIVTGCIFFAILFAVLGTAMENKKQPDEKRLMAVSTIGSKTE